MEMSGGIYTDEGVTEYNTSDFIADINLNEDKVETLWNKTNLEPAKSGETTKSRCYRLIAVCLLPLCVLLLTAIAVMWIEYTILKRENKKLQTSYNTMTNKRDQLQRDRDELQMFYKLGWIYFNSSIYYISKESKAWNESREDCRGRGADLVIINTKEEQEFLSKMLCSKKAWLGLNDRETEGDWKWLDDIPLNTKFWGSSEPNSMEGDEDCVVIGKMADTFQTWADYPCDHPFIWICEKTTFI